MKIEIITIGTEVLEGAVINTNAAFLSRSLTMHGYFVSQETTLSDDPMTLSQGIKEALERSDIVIATGGLGSTLDDGTRHVAAELFKTKFQYNETLARELYDRFKLDSNCLKDQASLPQEGEILSNRIGVSPGFIFQDKKKHLILLPGVPHEMEVMCEEGLIPFLQSEVPPQERLITKLSHLCLQRESDLDSYLREMKIRFPDIGIGIYPKYGTVTVCFKGKDLEQLSFLKEEFEKNFQSFVFSSSCGDITEAIQKVMVEKRKTLALAESCTGGALAKRLTAIPGSSLYFLGSIVSYSEEMKQKVLSVSKNTLDIYGAVSKETTSEMLFGLFEKIDADYGISVCGVAGPATEKDRQPVGTIYAAIGERGGCCDLFHFQFHGNRSSIIEATVERLLGIFWRKMMYNLSK